MLYVLGKLTLWPLKRTQNPSISVCVLDTEVGETSQKACVTIQEKTFHACFASLLAHLLQIRNPSQTFLYITLPGPEKKHELESTLKNMNFIRFTVSTPS